MITPQDKSIINTNGDDREFLSFKFFQAYDLKKDIKIESDNFGVKNLLCILKAQKSQFNKQLKSENLNF